MPFSRGSCRLETSRLIWVVNQLTSFYMVWVFTKSFFRTDFLIFLLVSPTYIVTGSLQYVLVMLDIFVDYNLGGVFCFYYYNYNYYHCYYCY